MRHLLALTVVLFLLVSSTSMAHQQKEAYSTVLFNQRTGLLEISHRFYIHDAEHVVSHLFGGKADLIQSENTRIQFAGYIKHSFLLKDTNGNALVLQSVGHEVEGKYFWVYQEYSAVNMAGSLHIKMTALQELWRSQVNQVNVEKDGWIRSLRFSATDQWKSVSLDAQ